MLLPATGVCDETVALGENVQAAVDRCRSGGSVRLQAGTHVAELKLRDTNDVYVFGAGASLRGNHISPALLATSTKATFVGLRFADFRILHGVDVKGGNVRFQECTFEAAQNSFHTCVRVDGDCTVALIGCNISGGTIGVEISGRDYGITNNAYNSNVRFNSCVIANCSKVGVKADTPTKLTLHACEIRSCGGGVDVYGSVSDVVGSLRMEGNNVHHITGTGVKLGKLAKGSCPANVLINNKIHVCSVAGVCWQGRGTRGEMRGCAVWGNTGPGLLICDGACPQITKNEISNGLGVGVRVRDKSTWGRLSSNKIWGNVKGVEILGEARPKLKGNTIRDHSMCGVMVGVPSRPNVPVRRELAAIATDNVFTCNGRANVHNQAHAEVAAERLLFDKHLPDFHPHPLSFVSFTNVESPPKECSKCMAYISDASGGGFRCHDLSCLRGGERFVVCSKCFMAAYVKK